MMTMTDSINNANKKHLVNGAVCVKDCGLHGQKYLYQNCVRMLSWLTHTSLWVDLILQPQKLKKITVYACV